MSGNSSFNFLILYKNAFSIGVGYSAIQCKKAKSLPLLLNKLCTFLRFLIVAPPVDIIIFLFILDTSFNNGQSSTEQDAIFNTSTPNSSNSGRDSLSKGVDTLNNSFEWI